MSNRYEISKRDNVNAILFVFIIFSLIGAWFTHIIHCLNEGLWGFLIAGALVFPIAIIHGIGLWFGFF